MDNYVITIARGFGSGGRVLAGKLADELGIHSYEHRILTLASQMSGREMEDFIETDEKLRGDGFSRMIQGLKKRLSPVPEMEAFVSDDRLFECEAKIIRKLAEEESCIIVGKCADYVLKDRNNVLSVYVDAPRDFCRAQVIERLGVSMNEADAMIESTDRYRAEYYRHYTRGKDWTDMSNYDVTLNSGRLGLDGCMKAIKHMMLVKFNDRLDPETREKLLTY
ncbi:MAG: cytidylate kinase-like family protein [Lachnospiraceae bacterium]|nr:cytidylate kinase-like family protein [Lachnospiraceae bacterium]